MTALAFACVVAALVWELRRRGESVARARHEIAGPLQAASLALETARRERPSPRLAAIDLELRRAALALDDLSGTRREALARVDVGCLLAEQALAWQPSARARGRTLRVAVASGLLVEADRVRLAQAVGNLLANAVEHGAGTIELCALAEGDAVRIEVRDEGPGVPRTLRRPRAGRGRGLAIAADAVARSGGRLTPTGHPVIELPAA